MNVSTYLNVILRCKNLQTDLVRKRHAEDVGDGIALHLAGRWERIERVSRLAQRRLLTASGRQAAQLASNEKRIAELETVINVVLDGSVSPVARANWLRLILDTVDPFKTNMLLRDWLEGVITALEGMEPK